MSKQTPNKNTPTLSELRTRVQFMSRDKLESMLESGRTLMTLYPQHLPVDFDERRDIVAAEMRRRNNLSI